MEYLALDPKASPLLPFCLIGVHLLPTTHKTQHILYIYKFKHQRHSLTCVINHSFNELFTYHNVIINEENSLYDKELRILRFYENLQAPVTFGKAVNISQ